VPTLGKPHGPALAAPRARLIALDLAAIAFDSLAKVFIRARVVPLPPPFSPFAARHGLEHTMDIKDTVALVTGANRGLGKSFVEALLAQGAAKVYAAMRTLPRSDTGESADLRVIPVKLDVTSPEDINAVASQCADLTLLVNNAGAMLMTPMLKEGSDVALRHEMEVNVYGMLAMIRTFAPILAKNGGGAIVNMLSVVSWLTVPFNATYCATKHAALVVSDASRIELKRQGTQVVGVYAGFIDTEMAAGINQPKTPPRQVADRALEGVVSGKDHVHADARAEEVWRTTREHPYQLAALQQHAWDTRPK
jgi:NAD(P)-dependent dehydrogenase (short-subunit alcohol dehydrogenase family)